MRIVFCLFADSIGLLPEHVFRDMVRAHRTRPKKFRLKLTDLFAAMSAQDPDDRYFGTHDIKYFNGGLFNDNRTIELNEGDMGILYDAAKDLDWSHIEPAIFGTLFERSLDADKRSLIGAHYTSSADILLLIEPVVMQPLRRRWAEIQQQITTALNSNHDSTNHTAASVAEREARHTAASAAEIEARHTAASAAERDKQINRTSGFSRRDEAAPALSPARDTQPKTQPTLRQRAAAEDLLSIWLDELTAVTVLDPACGSGNFLYIALQQLLDLWKESKNFALSHGLAVVRPGKVTPRQLFGIETDPYAHELSSMVVWIGYLQWMHQHGEPITNEPILEKLSNIEHADAILRYDTNNKPYEPTWPKTTYIVGNPPFLGGKFLRRELGDAYIDDLFGVYKDRVKAEADLVVYWFEKAREQLEQDHIHSAGLLATQGIRGGANRFTLQRIQQLGHIFFAWSDRKWTLAGAAVHVSLIAFTKAADTQPMLNGQPVAAINADLSLGADVTSVQCLLENANLCFMGTTKVGAFDITPDVARRMLAAPLNPNGRPNADVVKRWVNASDVTGRDRGMFIIDFGTSMPETEAALYELPFEYLRQHVKPTRSESNRDLGERPWWLHGRARPDLRAALQQLAHSSEQPDGRQEGAVGFSPRTQSAIGPALAAARYLITPGVSKHRVFAWLAAEILPDHALFAFARDDDYFFGVLHSRIHELWSRAQGTQLREVESGFRYTPKTTFDTFPFPWPPNTEPKDDPRVHAIAAAAKSLVDLRDRWLNPPDTPEADLKKRTLTNLYNNKPQWLQDAHRTLDEAVFAAYNWPPTLTDQQILEHLLTLNHQRAATQATEEAGGTKASG